MDAVRRAAANAGAILGPGRNSLMTERGQDFNAEAARERASTFGSLAQALKRSSISVPQQPPTANYDGASTEPPVIDETLSVLLRAIESTSVAADIEERAPETGAILEFAPVQAPPAEAVRQMPIDVVPEPPPTTRRKASVPRPRRRLPGSSLPPDANVPDTPKPAGSEAIAARPVELPVPPIPASGFGSAVASSKPAQQQPVVAQTPVVSSAELPGLRPEVKSPIPVSPQSGPNQAVSMSAAAAPVPLAVAAAPVTTPLANPTVVQTPVHRQAPAVTSPALTVERSELAARAVPSSTELRETRPETKPAMRAPSDLTANQVVPMSSVAASIPVGAVAAPLIAPPATPAVERATVESVPPAPTSPVFPVDRTARPEPAAPNGGAPIDSRTEAQAAKTSAPELAPVVVKPRPNGAAPPPNRIVTTPVTAMPPLTVRPTARPPATVQPKNGKRRLRLNMQGVSAFLDRVEDWLEALVEKEVQPALAQMLEKRRGWRIPNPPLVAHYWTGDRPEPRPIANISVSGVYVVTNDRWYPGTRICMTFQKSDQEKKTPGSWLAVDCQVVRSGKDGIGLAFVTGKQDPLKGQLRRVATRDDVERFVKALARPA